MVSALGHTLSAIRHMPQLVPALHWARERGPQSSQSLPRGQEANSEPGPPSLHSPSEAVVHSLRQMERVAPQGGPAGGGGAGGQGGGGGAGGGAGGAGGDGGIAGGEGGGSG